MSAPRSIRAEKVLRKIGEPSEDGCWIWRGSRNKRGYGEFFNWKAHRLVYEILVGAIDSSVILHHRCHKKLCVNPAHLEKLSSAAHVTLHRGGVYREGYCGKGHPNENGKRCAECWKAYYLANPPALIAKMRERRAGLLKEGT